MPAPLPLVRLELPPIYAVLASRPEPGAVCELPLGLRDGLGNRGRFDDGSLYRQTVHGRPIVGGFVARLPPSVTRSYEADPLPGALLRLSEGDASISAAALPDRASAAARLDTDRIAFVVLNRSL